ncbi:hypothetical protein RIF29_06103 [Crotalaria pallida]|uniref:Uncharacterized protein n=1 Tax=Crotalaria pallida TaxID=3830 RepID=A0AAN9PAP7_CROPI
MLHPLTTVLKKRLVFDHEECGSDSTQGAGSPVILNALSRIANSFSSDPKAGLALGELQSIGDLYDFNSVATLFLKRTFTNTLTYLSSDAFSSIPSELVSDLQRMLSRNVSSKPTAMDFTGSPFFRTDTRLRALRFLDHMLKLEVLKALSDMWKDFDSRALRYKTQGLLIVVAAAAISKA